MDVELLRQTVWGGERLRIGDVVSVERHVGAHWVQRGIARNLSHVSVGDAPPGGDQPTEADDSDNLSPASNAFEGVGTEGGEGGDESSDDDDDAESGEGEGDDDPDTDEGEGLEALSFSDLKQMAEERAVDTTKMRSKADIIAALTADEE